MAQEYQKFPTELSECHDSQANFPENVVHCHVWDSLGWRSCPSSVNTPGDGFSDQISAELAKSRLFWRQSLTNLFVHCYLHGKWLAGRARSTFFYNGIRVLEKCWTKCISVAADYVVMNCVRLQTFWMPLIKLCHIFPSLTELSDMLTVKLNILRMQTVYWQCEDWSSDDSSWSTHVQWSTSAGYRTSPPLHCRHYESPLLDTSTPHEQIWQLLKI